MLQDREQKNMKKIGNFLLLFFSLFPVLSIASDTTARLYVLDMQQNPIQQAEQAVPFLVQVVVDNGAVAAEPEFQGSKDFQLQSHGSSSSISITNGRRSERKIFNYIAVANQKGTFSLGPVSIQLSNGKKIEAASVSVRVGDRAVAHTAKSKPFFLTTELDKKRVYLGQEIVATIRFYFSEEWQDLKMLQPAFEGFAVGDLARVETTGTETITGREYQYQEWKLSLYPEKLGTVVVPSMQVTFLSLAQQHHGFGSLFDFFGMNSQQIAESPARSIEVVDLPQSPSGQQVSAVGSFDSFCWEILIFVKIIVLPSVEDFVSSEGESE